MNLTYLNINSELMIKRVASNLSMWAKVHPWDTCHPQRNPLLPQVRVEWEILGDQWRDMASHKSHKYCTVNGRVSKMS